ncbi:MAG TPA: response regulator [Nitrospira sp.]|nr:response regulator [Nitrospira sp.]
MSASSDPCASSGTTHQTGGDGLAEILLIDDESNVRDFFRKALEGAGYGVTEASSAKAGLSHLKTHPVDLVITDILMPDMDGLELTWVLHQQYPRVKVVAVSGGQHDIDYCSVARFFGAHETLMKPVALPRLLAAVHRLTGQSN